jgi:hypothetical protein
MQVFQDNCPYTAMPFADASRLAHVALSRYKTKDKKMLREEWCATRQGDSEK